MAQELKFADDIIVNMAQKTVRQRLAEILLYLEENFGTDKEGYLYLQLSRADIADVVGTATELLIRTLTKLKKEGLVVTAGKRIQILDKKALLQIVEGL
jgi:CRP-like cAMP-binding protein